MTTSLIPFMWYTSEAEEAAKFYVSIVPDSRIHSVTTMPADSPSGPEGSVTVVDMTIAGQRIGAMSAGPLEPFNHAISLMVECDTQAEIDRIWDALLDGGAPEECGWLRDRWGVSWQIAPRRLMEMIRGQDRAAAGDASHTVLHRGQRGRAVRPLRLDPPGDTRGQLEPEARRPRRRRFRRSVPNAR